jgi:hypothetical protein
MASSPSYALGQVPFNSPIDLTKGNPVRMGLHPILRGLRHTPETHGWNAFAALIEDVHDVSETAATQPQQATPGVIEKETAQSLDQNNSQTGP